MKNHNAELVQMLQKLVGDEAFRNVVLLLGGSNIYIPTTEQINKAARNEAIRKAYDESKPIEEIAAEYNLSVSHIRTIIYSFCNRK
jgi:Mor family transcriptional regulator